MNDSTRSVDVRSGPAPAGDLLRRLAGEESGQLQWYFLLFTIPMLLAVASTLQLEESVADKISLQSGVDASARRAGTRLAAVMNMIAANNLAILKIKSLEAATQGAQLAAKIIIGRILAFESQLMAELNEEIAKCTDPKKPDPNACKCIKRTVQSMKWYMGLLKWWKKICQYLDDMAPKVKDIAEKMAVKLSKENEHLRDSLVLKASVNPVLAAKIPLDPLKDIGVRYDFNTKDLTWVHFVGTPTITTLPDVLSPDAEKLFEVVELKESPYPGLALKGKQPEVKGMRSFEGAFLAGPAIEYAFWFGQNVLVDRKKPSEDKPDTSCQYPSGMQPKAKELGQVLPMLMTTMKVKQAFGNTEAKMTRLKEGWQAEWLVAGRRDFHYLWFGTDPDQAKTKAGASQVFLGHPLLYGTPEGLWATAKVRVENPSEDPEHKEPNGEALRLMLTQDFRARLVPIFTSEAVTPEEQQGPDPLEYQLYSVLSKTPMGILESFVRH